MTKMSSIRKNLHKKKGAQLNGRKMNELKKYIFKNTEESPVKT